ncbi:MAG TPA: HAD family hydrolase [Terriglobales bacterium]|nr:HAD family hydrolase [Terriglobales bacterium]
MLRAAVFDVDGTLVDTVDLHARAWQDAFRKWGKDVDFVEVRSQIGKGGDQLLPMFFSEKEIKSFGDEMSEWRGEHFKSVYLPQAKSFPKTRELFEALRERGVKLALASSAKEDELESYKKLANISDVIDAETNADEVQKTKPHPDIFAVALEKLGIPPQNAIAIGDSPFDAQSAGKIGLLTVGVLCGGFPEELLRAAGAVEIYRDPEDLLMHVEEQLMSVHEPIKQKERKYG